MSTITLTFGDVAENHKGMQMIGKKAEHGFSIEDLRYFQDLFPENESFLYDLNSVIDVEAEPAALLLVRDGLRTLCDYEKLVAEQLALPYDTRAFMYGRVVNKHARHNLCFAEYSQEADYENGRGTVLAYSSLTFLDSLRKKIGSWKNCENLLCESNFYYDVSKTGIGYHGDSERRKVIGCRLGAGLPLHYQWYHRGNPIGRNMKFDIKGGDIYFMSEKAVGTDWKSKNVPTLRHAAGSAKYTNIV